MSSLASHNDSDDGSECDDVNCIGTGIDDSDGEGYCDSNVHSKKQIAAILFL